jgi:Uma2 family endonuclease
MATDLRSSETSPAGLDSDALALYEVVDGKIVEKPPMGAMQSVLGSVLHGLLAPFVRSHRLGRTVAETLFLIRSAPERQRRPDVAFVSTQRWPLSRPVPDREYWDVIPDLAVEIISKSNTAEAIAEKIEEYFAAGVRLVWVVYPVTTKVYVYDSPTQIRVLTLGDELDGRAVLPGFRVALADLFESGEEDSGVAQP